MYVSTFFTNSSHKFCECSVVLKRTLFTIIHVKVSELHFLWKPLINGNCYGFINFQRAFTCNFEGRLETFKNETVLSPQPPIKNRDKLNLHPVNGDKRECFPCKEGKAGMFLSVQGLGDRCSIYGSWVQCLLPKLPLVYRALPCPNGISNTVSDPRYIHRGEHCQGE